MQRPAYARARTRVVAGIFVAAVLAFAPSCLYAQSAGANGRGGDQRESPEVRSLVLNGVHAVSRLDLERSISTTQSQCKNLLLIAFCWMSKSPLFIDKRYLDRTEFRR